AGVTAIAEALAAAQIERIGAAIATVRARHHGLRPAVVTGLGGFFAGRAAQQAGLDVVSLASALGNDAARCAPAASVALLLDQQALGSRPRTLKGPLYVGHQSIDTVVKIGGGLLAHEGSLDTVLNVLA